MVDGAGATLREYIYWGNQQIAFIANGATYYIHNDHLNTPQVVTNQNQQVVWMANYEPFGKLAANQSNSIELFSRFPGQYLDPETGLYYNYFRDYDPSIGRYIESDPIGLRGGINTYLYVDGKPITSVDLFGLQAGGDYPPPLPGSRPGGFHPDTPDGRPGKPYVIGPDGNKWTPHTEDIGHWPHWDGPNGQTWPANANKPRPNQKKPKPGQSPTNPNDPDAEPWVPPERPTPGDSAPVACPDGSTCHQVIQATRNAAGAVLLYATYWLCTAS